MKLNGAFKIRCCINVKAFDVNVLTDGKEYEVTYIRFCSGETSFKVIDDMGVERYYNVNYFQNIELKL